jgi:GTP-binding protein
MTHMQARGTFFIEPGAEVYEGMVIGQHIRPEDLAINVTKTKSLSAVHTKYYGEELRLGPPRVMSLDDCIEFLSDDELLEVTPESLRIRKRILNNERAKNQRRVMCPIRKSELNVGVDDTGRSDSWQNSYG